MKLNEIELKSIIREEINRLMTEEMSIADEVKVFSNEIINNILNHKNYDFIIDFFNLGEYRIIYTPTNDDKNGATNIKQKTITINTPIVNNKIVEKDLYDVVYHEIEHLFQVSKMEETENGTNKSFNKVYITAIKICNDENASYYEEELGRYVYCCSTLEQDAFVNGLYATLSNANIISKNQEVDEIKQSQAYRALMTIRDIRNDIYDNMYEYKNAAKIYGKPIKWFIYLGNNAEKRLKQKIRKVISKSRSEKIDKNFSTNINL